MRKIQILLIFVVSIFFVTSTVMSQKVKNTMTNADVVEMVKAGLPESTIIIAIQQSELNFDISTKALIELSKQGVSQKIMEAMLQPKVTTPISGQTKVSNYSAVTLIDGEKRISMKGSQSIFREGNTIADVFIPFKSTKSHDNLDGNRAQLRVSDTTPEFEVTLPADVNPKDYLVLIKFKVKSDRREVETGKVGITGMSFGFRKESIVSTTFEEIKNPTADGVIQNIVYRVKVINPLPPGEYAFAPQSLYYDFGIDKGQ